MNKVGSYTFVRTIGLMLTLIPLSAMAATADLSRFVDNGNTILDTGLEWLEATESRDHSSIEMLDELEPEGMLEGYRYSGENEIFELLDTFQGPDYVPALSRPKGAFRSIDMLSETYHAPSRRWGWESITSLGRGAAYYSPAEELLTPVYGITIYDPKHPSSGMTEYTVPAEALAFGVGSFLVRNNGSPHVVPEINGGTAPLALGLLLMAYLVRREKRRRN